MFGSSAFRSTRGGYPGSAPAQEPRPPEGPAANVNPSPKSNAPAPSGDMVTVVPTVHVLDLRPNEQATIKRTSEVTALIRKGVLVEVDERPVFRG